MSLFIENDRKESIEYDKEDSDYEYKNIIYQSNIKTIKTRLNIMGFNLKTLENAFNKSKQYNLDNFNEEFEERDKKSFSDFLNKFTFDDYLSALKEIYIKKIDFFDNAFAGMLRWEDFMADDMFPLFAIDGVDKSIREKKFKDLVFRNQDIRILTDAQDQILLVYSFPDRQTLIITTDIETFDEIINRLNTPKPLSL